MSTHVPFKYHRSTFKATTLSFLNSHAKQKGSVKSKLLVQSMSIFMNQRAVDGVFIS